MAIPGITYRLEKGSSLTHTEMDNNFRSLFYSSSIHDGGDTLRLHYDTNASDYEQIPLNGGSGGLTITGNVDNRVVTATGTPGLVQGESNFTFDGDVLTIAGRVSQDDGGNNVFIGLGAGDSISGATRSIGIGFRSGENLTGDNNVSYGYGSLGNALASSNTVAIGYNSLNSLSSGNTNVALGTSAGINLSSGAGNLYLGNAAGPTTSTGQSNKLYINNAASNTPLVLGDFATGHVAFNSTVSASVFSGSYYGDGSNLTGLTAAAEWDGTLDGDAQITGSLTVSGSSVVVDLTNTLAISGSVFSGSFYGDGSNLTGVQADTFPYTGSAKITGSLSVKGPSNVTGSFTVSGSSPVINLKGDTYIDDNIHIHNKNTTSIGIGQNSLSSIGSGVTNNIAIGLNASCAATGRDSVVIGSNAGQRHGNYSVLIGRVAGVNTTGCYNTAVGYSSLQGSGNGRYNVAFGSLSLTNTTSGIHNTGLGHFAVRGVQSGGYNTGVGSNSLYALDGKNQRNTAVGAFSGFNAKGNCNVLIGYYAGPATYITTISNKLYINNNASDTPLIYGDFSTGQVTINSQLSASIFSGSYYGDGSNLTGVDWDGSRDGDASITGSLTVSGSTNIVDFTNVSAISGSTFSGSFVGDGSGLTGVTSEWDGTRDGNSQITGSLIVSGAIDAVGSITIASEGFPGSPGVEMIHFHSASLVGNNNLYTFPIDSSTGYTGIKVDYSLSNTNESEKKIGTLLGAWDQSGNSTINDSHTIAEGAVNTTAFSIDASSTTDAILKLDASAGTYDVNMLITAFKRQV